jgi:hypothetical protein
VSEIANADQHAAWNGESGHRWVTDADRRDRALAPIADALVAAAHLDSGEQVLDIGCGCGATSLAAARAVAPGRVYGIDLSEPMLEVAGARADDQGIAGVDFVPGDAQTHALPPGRFAVAISRFGTMFFADPVAAFANVAAALAPGGRLCLATWQPLAANDWLTTPGDALLRYGHRPETQPGAPGMFAQSDPDTVTATLDRAGYTGIDLAPVTVSLTVGRDLADATDYVVKTGPGRAVLDTIPDDQRAPAIEAVRDVLAHHTDPTGVHLDAAVWIVTATRAP